ncbi:sigma 54-interacting transcriptional regulator [Azospirillum sp. TSH100]|uniref:sigma 54-interacting transcriptional regulator n=1 Tax=Azospirillum sp. TSH100 TaxID=652764 RepID=UPI001FFF572B|nr:sigma 54-interacting transcriptional regulator [Azospirillum sp. TSH100]
MVSATHRDLETMVAQGAFREDFYYRLKGLILRTPALAERREDVALLAPRFLVDASRHRPLRLTRWHGWLPRIGRAMSANSGRW